MEIFINDNKIDFQLENETVLHHVIEGIDDWTEKDGFHIQDIFFDNKPYSRTDAECTEMPLEQVTELKIIAKTRMEIHQDNLQLLYQYISLFLKSIEGWNTKLIKDLQTESGPVTHLLSQFLEEDYESDSSISRKLYTNINNFSFDDSSEGSALNEPLVHYLSSLKIILYERISELSNPLGELVKTTAALKLTQNEINDISVLLQTGKDREALNSIIKFSELNQKTLRLYPLLKNTGIIDINVIVIDDKNISDYYSDLNGILSELIEAFTANDSVLIGDLLEYEVAPRLESLIGVLEGIQEDQLL